MGGRGKGRQPRAGADAESRLEQLEWLVDEQQDQIRQLCEWTQEHATVLAEVDRLKEQARDFGEVRGKMFRELSAASLGHQAARKEQVAIKKQLRPLRDLRGRLAEELAVLGRSHAALLAEHRALRECLAGERLFEAPQLRQRSAALQPLGALERCLEEPRVGAVLRRLDAGQGRGVASLAVASRAFEPMRRAPAAPHCGDAPAVHPAVGSKPPSRPAGKAIELDGSRLCEIEDYDPLPEVLKQWAESETVHGVLGSFGVEGVVGEPEMVKFGDVCDILRQLGLRLDHFVSKFSHLPVSEASSGPGDVEDAAYKILERFASTAFRDKDAMECRDLYRLLEIIGFSLRKFKSVYNGAFELEEENRRTYIRIGDYRIRRQIGRGFTGVCCYLGEHVEDSKRVAIKWPAKPQEVAAFEEIQRRSPQDCLGLPRLLASGTFQDEPFLVTELFGSPLMKLFQCLEGHPAERRWETLRVVGRLLVRRLRALHACGYVHCDISPENVLFGRPRGPGRGAMEHLCLYLIDFELAQRHPWGKRLEAQMGSAEWSSIQSAEGGLRLPEDDLEALGWMLLHGLAGPLPWFEWLGTAYKDWDSKWTRDHVLKQVQRAKVGLLAEDWEAFARRGSERLPEEPLRFIQACRPHSACYGRPDYGELLELLGGRARASTSEADQEDLRQLGALLLHLRKSPRERAVEERRKAQARKALAKAVAARDVEALRAALEEGERAGLQSKDLCKARSIVNEEELRDDVRESLRESVASGDVRRICSDIREAEAVGLGDSELEGAREALAEVERQARRRLQDAARGSCGEAFRAAIEEGELAGLGDEELERARREFTGLPAEEALPASCA